MCSWFMPLILKLYRVFSFKNSKERVFIPMTNICLNPTSAQLTAKLPRISPKIQGRAEASPPSPTAPASWEPAGAHAPGRLESDLLLSHQPALQLGCTVVCKPLLGELRIKLYNTVMPSLWRLIYFEVNKHIMTNETLQIRNDGQRD